MNVSFRVTARLYYVGSTLFEMQIFMTKMYLNFLAILVSDTASVAFSQPQKTSSHISKEVLCMLKLDTDLSPDLCLAHQWKHWIKKPSLPEEKHFHRLPCLTAKPYLTLWEYHLTCFPPYPPCNNCVNMGPSLQAKQDSSIQRGFSHRTLGPSLNFQEIAIYPPYICSYEFRIIYF